MLEPGQVIRLDKDSGETLGKQLLELTTDLEDEYRSLLTRDIPVWWRNYYAIPRIKGLKNFPFKGASNVVIPFIQLQSDALISRTFSALFGTGTRIWGTKTEREDLATQAKNVARWANDDARRFDYKLAFYDWLAELIPIGSSVLGLRYTKDIRRMFYGSAAARGTKAPESGWVEMSRGVRLEHIPREQVLWDTRYRIWDAPIVIREHCYTKAQLLQLINQEKAQGLVPSWNEYAVRSLSDNNSSDSSLSSEARKFKNKIDSREERGFRNYGGRDIRECYLQWPVVNSLGFEDPNDPDPNATNLPVVIHMDRETGMILRLVAYPYYLDHWPFYDGFFRKDSGRGHGGGTSQRLWVIQEIIATLFNQSFDSVTRANSIWAKTTDPTWQTREIDPSRFLYVGANIHSVEEMKLTPSVQPNIALMNFANIIGERLTGIADPAFGRESRQGGHPSPAASTLALMEQSQILTATTTSLLRDTVSRVGEDWAVLTQQYETNEEGELQRRFGASDAAQMEQLMFPTGPIPGNIQFTLVAMDENFNPDTEMRRAVTVDQMTERFWTLPLQALTQLNQLPPEMRQMFAPVWQGYIKARTETFSRFLEAADIDDIETFIGRNGPQSGMDTNAAAQQQLTSAGTQLGGAGNQMGQSAGNVSQPGLSNGAEVGYADRARAVGGETGGVE